jgi:signal transduction histidine kinase
MENTRDPKADGQAKPRSHMARSRIRGWALLPDFSKLLFIAVVLPVLSITTLHLWQSREVAREQYAARLADAAMAHSREIDAFIQLHTAALQVVAERRTTTGNVDDENQWAADMRRMHRYYPDFSTLALVDADGRLVLTEPAAPQAPGVSVADRSYYTVPKRTSRPYVSDAYRGRVVSQLPSIALSVPFFSGKRFAGVICGAIRIDSFPALRRLPDQAQDFEILLVDRSHTVVHATSGLPYRSLDSLQTNGRDRALRFIESASSSAVMQRVPGILLDGGDAYVVMTPLSNGWDLLVLVPESRVDADVRHNMAVTLGLLGLVLVGVLVVTGVQLKRLGVYVRDLLDRMHRFALDNQALPASPEVLPVELAPLAEALNQLASRAHHAYEEVSSSLDEQRRLREELQAMAGRLITIQENERRTLSRELHDDIGQAITAIKLGAMALQDEPDPDRRHEILDEIVGITDQTVAKLRNLSMLLRPPQLDTLGLETALRWQADTLFRSGSPRLEMQLEPLPERPDPAVELACFRIAQEALTNILRHSKARHVSLTLAPDAAGEELHLAVTDDGQGFRPNEIQGLGLVTMRERAQQLGGSLHIDTEPGAGTKISLTLPMHRGEASPV